MVIATYHTVTSRDNCRCPADWVTQTKTLPGEKKVSDMEV
jgi:hypothetical protein